MRWRSDFLKVIVDYTTIIKDRLLADKEKMKELIKWIKSLQLITCNPSIGINSTLITDNDDDLIKKLGEIDTGFREDQEEINAMKDEIKKGISHTYHNKNKARMLSYICSSRDGMHHEAIIKTRTGMDLDPEHKNKGLASIER